MSENRTDRGGGFVVLPVLAALFSIVPGAVAQDPTQGTFAGEVTVSEVVLDVVVTDRRGNVVVGLDETDFRVEEDGRRVEIEQVTFYSHRELLGSASLAQRLNADPELRANRYFILFFHDQRRLLPRLAAQQLDAARWAKRWIRSDLKRGDYVAVFSYEVGLRPQADFSDDPDAIAKAIDRAVVSEDTPPSRWAPPADGAPSLLAGLPGGEALRRTTKTVYDALTVLARSADRIPGRKNLILFSLGFGEETEFGFYTPDSRYFPELIQVFNDANLATYAVDLIPSGGGGVARPSQLGNSLSHLASETGGDYYFTFGNFAVPLEQVDEDTSGYYLLTYRARHPAGESGYQRVTVSTVNPRFRARAREGYLYGGGNDGG